MVKKELEGRSILVLGGSSGIGLTAVSEFVKAGATVLVGATKPESFERAMRHLTRRGRLDVENLPIHMFNADITDKRQIEREAWQAKNRGVNLTDVVFSQAAGMESITSRLDTHLDPIIEITFTTPIDELEEDKRIEVEKRLETMRADLAIWTVEAFPHAQAVLYQGTFDAIDVLDGVFPGGFKGVALNSTWGHLSGRAGVEIPLLYRPIDLAKGMLRDKLDEEAAWMAELMGINMGVVIASLVNDTRVGKMFNDFFLNLMVKDQREAVRASSVHSKDVAQAIKMVLDWNPKYWKSHPFNLFVYKENERVVLGKLLPMSAMYTIPYKF